MAEDTAYTNKAGHYDEPMDKNRCDQALLRGVITLAEWCDHERKRRTTALGTKVVSSITVIQLDDQGRPR